MTMIKLEYIAIIEPFARHLKISTDISSELGKVNVHYYLFRFN